MSRLRVAAVAGLLLIAALALPTAVGKKDNDSGGVDGEGDEFYICHYPPGQPDRKQTLKVNESAWPRHEAHGDAVGECNEDSDDDGSDEGESDESDDDSGESDDESDDESIDPGDDESDESDDSGDESDDESSDPGDDESDGSDDSDDGSDDEPVDDSPALNLLGFDASLTSAYVGSTEHIVGTAFSSASPAAIELLTISNDAEGITHARNIAGWELSGTSEQAPIKVGPWKVWYVDENSVGFDYIYIYTAQGVHTWSLRAETATDFVAASLQVNVGPSQIDDNLVEQSGAVMSDSMWGEWAADPGSIAVETTNYIRVENTGSTPTQAFILDFDNDLFLHSDGLDAFPLSGNIRFGFVEVADTATPDASTLTWVEDDDSVYGLNGGDGAIHLQFTDIGNYFFISYEIVEFPEILRDGEYLAPYTVTLA